MMAMRAICEEGQSDWGYFRECQCPLHRLHAALPLATSSLPIALACVSSCAIEIGRPRDGPMTSSMSAKCPADTNPAASAAASKFMRTFCHDRASANTGGARRLPRRPSIPNPRRISHRGRCATRCPRLRALQQRTTSASHTARTPCRAPCCVLHPALLRTGPARPLHRRA